MKHPDAAVCVPSPWLQTAAAGRPGSAAACFQRRRRWEGLTGWFGMNSWCLVNCPPVLCPRPPGETRPWSSRPASPAAEGGTPGEAPPPPGRRSGYSVSPPPWVHSRPDMRGRRRTDNSHLCDLDKKKRTREDERKHLRWESSRSRWRRSGSLCLLGEDEQR